MAQANAALIFSFAALVCGSSQMAAGQSSEVLDRPDSQQLTVEKPVDAESPTPQKVSTKVSSSPDSEATDAPKLKRSQIFEANPAAGPDSGESTEAPAEVAVAINQARSLSLAFRHAAARALPSVVMIFTRMSDEGDEDEIAVRDLLDTAANFDSVGSGVIMSSDGLIVTNQHVVQDAKRIQVRLADGRRFNVRDVKGDKKSDIAILRIDGENLPAALEGDSDSLYVGDWVLTIGSPFTLQSSVSAGIISGRDRWHSLSKDVRGQFLQVDAAINPGNSGGPLIDLEGKVVGINTAITSRNGGFQGIGFSIPMRRASWVMKELSTYGRVRRGYAGLRTGDVPFSVARTLGLARGTGAYVVSVTHGYSAKKSGLMSGDVILEYDGLAVTSSGRLAEVIQQSMINAPIKMLVQRGDEQIELTIRLEERQ